MTSSAATMKWLVPSPLRQRLQIKTENNKILDRAGNNNKAPGITTTKVFDGLSIHVSITN